MIFFSFHRFILPYTSYLIKQKLKIEEKLAKSESKVIKFKGKKGIIKGLTRKQEKRLIT